MATTPVPGIDVPLNYTTPVLDPGAVVPTPGAVPGVDVPLYYTTPTNPSGPVVMTPDNLSPAAPVNLPQPSTNTTQAEGLVAGATTASKSIQDYVKELTPAPTAAERQEQGLLNDIGNLTGQDTGRAQAQIDAEAASGATAARKNLTDINNELITANAAYERLNTRVEGQAISMGNILGQQAQLRRQQASDIGLITARAQVAQGNLALALETANRAVDAKYETIEDQIRVKQAQLAALQPILSREEKVQAAAQARYLDDQAQKVADRKTQEQAIQNIMIEAAKNGADAGTIAKIQKAGSVTDAINLAGAAFGADFRAKQQQQAFENQIALKQLGVSQMNAQTARMNVTKSTQTAQTAVSGELQLVHAQDSIAAISGLLDNKALNSAVGPIAAARGGVTLPFGIKIPTTIRGFTGERQNFIGGVEQLRSNLNLNALINAKANGATFGALSDQEMQLLASSATRIGSWAVKDKSGQVTGYNIDERSFRMELDKINNFAKLDYVLRGGDPNAVGVTINSDGTAFTTTYDGKPQQIYP